MLPAVGTCTYNGHTFNGSLKSRVSARFVYDQAERTIVYVVYTLDMTQIITNSGSATDTSMDDLRNRLSTPGAPIAFTTKGLGTMDVNRTLNGQLDVVWGPKPRALDMEPIGSNLAWRVRWVCEVAIPQCTTTAQYQNAPLAFNYEMTYAVGEDGLQTRTYEGYIEIPLSRRPGFPRGVPTSADFYRDQINPPPVEGFRRRPGDFKLSADRRTLNFTIQDIQMTPDQLPEFCTDAGGSHSIRTAVENTFLMTGELSASYRVNPNQPKTRAWEMFYLLMQFRLGVAEAASGRSGVFRLQQIELTEGLYRDALNMNFKANYFFMTTPEKLLLDSGQWLPMPNTVWENWVQTNSDVLGSRGQAGLFYNVQDDSILDLCLPIGRPPTSPGIQRSIKTIPDSDFLGNPDDPNNSYLSLQTRTIAGCKPGTSLIDLLPMFPQPDPKINNAPFGGVQVTPDQPRPDGSLFDPNQNPNIAPGALDSTDLNHGPVFKPGVSANYPVNDVVADQIAQQRIAPKYFVTLEGQAVRVGYPIPPPMLVTQNGAYCVPTGYPQFAHEQIGNWFGTPIYGAAWSIPYKLVGVVSGAIPVPWNPFLANQRVA